jgi:hypothetical protein
VPEDVTYEWCAGLDWWFGELPLVPLPADDHTRIDPRTEFLMKRPDLGPEFIIEVSGG